MKRLIAAVLAVLVSIASSGCGGIQSINGKPPAPSPSAIAVVSPAGTGMPAPGPTASARRPSALYGTLKLLFSAGKTGLMQGLAYSNGKYFVSYDMGSGKGKIIVCSDTGKVLKTTGLLPTEHSAELAYRYSDKQLYVSNGQPGATVKIFAVDIENRSPTVTKVIFPNTPGYGGLVAVDNTRDLMLISTNSDILHFGKPELNAAISVTIYTCDFNGKALSRFTIPFQGIPQGIECCNGLIYFYTNNKVTVLDESGNIIKTYILRQSGESEGIALVLKGKKPVFAVGYNSPNRVLSLVLP